MRKKPSLHVCKEVYDNNVGLYKYGKGMFISCAFEEFRATYHEHVVVRVNKERTRIWINALGGNRTVTAYINDVLKGIEFDVDIETSNGRMWLRRGAKSLRYDTTMVTFAI